MFPEGGYDDDWGSDWDGDVTEPASVEPAGRTADPICENDDDLVDADTHSDEIDPGQDMHDAIREGANDVDEGFEPDGEDRDDFFKIKIVLTEEDMTMTIVPDDINPNESETVFGKKDTEVASIEYLFQAIDEDDGKSKIVSIGSNPYPNGSLGSSVSGSVTSIEPRSDGSTDIALQTTFGGKDADMGNVTVVVPGPAGTSAEYNSPTFGSKSGTATSIVVINVKIVNGDVVHSIKFQSSPNFDQIKIPENVVPFPGSWIEPNVKPGEFKMGVDVWNID